jgi:uncharacterized protein (DUF1697 family)
VKYVALLRGINVGGNKLMKMCDVRDCLEGRDFTRVTTYIQSGNVLFESDKPDVAKLTATMEKTLSKTFGHEVPVFLRSWAQLKKVVAQAPKEWKSGRALRQNVAFLRAPLTAGRAAAEIDLRPGVDSVEAGDGVLYMSTVMSRVSQSRLSKIVGTPIYAHMTIRSYSTCQKILAMMRDG